MVEAARLRCRRLTTADDINPITLKDPKLWELYAYSLLWGNAGFISSTVVQDD